MKAYWFSQHGQAMFGHKLPYVVRPEPYYEDADRVELGRSGLHASVHPFDARQHRYDGSTLDLVELGGVIKSADYPDRHVASKRTHLARIETSELLVQFNRWCALQATYLWDCPPIVTEFLEGLDYPGLREAVREWLPSRTSTTRQSAVVDRAIMAVEISLVIPLSVAISDQALLAIRLSLPSRSPEAGAAEQAQRDKFQELVTEAFAKVGVTV